MHYLLANFCTLQHLTMQSLQWLTEWKLQIDMWSCATSSASSSLVNGPSQNRLQTVNSVCHNFFSVSSPAYFSCQPFVHTPSRRLHSSAVTWILHIPHVRAKTFGQCCFSYCASKKWNSLPFYYWHLSQSTLSIMPWKLATLKTHLHKQSHKWFQILSSYLTPLFLLTSSVYIPSVCPCACMHACMFVCVILWLHNWLFLRF